jgi:hypothetical protein
LVLRDRRSGQVAQVRPASLFLTQERVVQIRLPDMGQCLLLSGVWRDDPVAARMFFTLALCQWANTHA